MVKICDCETYLISNSRKLGIVRNKVPIKESSVENVYVNE